MKTRMMVFSAFMVTLLMGSVLIAGDAQQGPKDCAKPESEKAMWEDQSKFAKFHGEGGSGFSAYGSYQEARDVLYRALHGVESIYSSYEKVSFLERALDDARSACGNEVDKYRRLIKVVDNSTNAIIYSDVKFQSLREGLRYLTRGQTTGSMTKDVLTLGLALTKPAMSSYNDAVVIFKRVLRAALAEARSENEQWASLLEFAQRAAQTVYHQQSNFKVQSVVARSIIEANEGQSIFLQALSRLANVSLSNSYDQVSVLTKGLEEYGSEVPSKTHELVSEFLVAVSGKLYNKDHALLVLRSALDKFQRLAFDAPPAKVLLQIGKEVSSNGAVDGYTRYNLCGDAMRRVRRLDLPDHVSKRLLMALVDSEDSYGSYDEKIRILHRCIDSLL